MAYPNIYQQNYQQAYPGYYSPTLPQTASNVNSGNNLIWVQGEAGAKSYLVAPNTTVPLWDSEQKVIYLKSADASGMPSIKYIDYTIRETNQPINNTIKTEEYVTKNDLEALKEEVSNLKKKLETTKAKKPANQKRREVVIVDDDEE